MGLIRFRIGFVAVCVMWLINKHFFKEWRALVEQLRNDHLLE